MADLDGEVHRELITTRRRPLMLSSLRLGGRLAKEPRPADGSDENNRSRSGAGGKPPREDLANQMAPSRASSIEALRVRDGSKIRDPLFALRPQPELDRAL
jgi:hypothetical protein